jgi:hypothetical protein
MYPSRISDKVLDAFKQACDQGNLTVAEHLLRALEVVANGAGADRQDQRYEHEPIVQSVARLEALKRSLVARDA